MRQNAVLVATALLLIPCGSARAQSTAAPVKPGPEVEKLGAYVGEWNVAGRLRARSLDTPGGKISGTDSCEWIADGFGVLCRERILFTGEGQDNLTHEQLFLIAYDGEAKRYTCTQVSARGGLSAGHGKVKDGTWTWSMERKYNGKPYLVHFVDKFTSPDSREFSTEIEINTGSMELQIKGTETRTNSSAPKPVDEKN